ncbi:MFS transporter [Tatumella saanichensis]|uniref:MFS transporter n=1 Tax=Tatumella saanichensis TaxID=480813 RepID=UPI0004AEF91A|nr:MFS transporter [Tatumella saanichensis]
MWRQQLLSVPHFAAFTYIQPMLTRIQAVPFSGVSALLLVSGLAGIFGNVIAGKLIDRHLKRLITLNLFISAIALVLLGLKGLAPLPIAAIIALLVLWGAAIAIIFVGLQTWVLRNAGDAAQAASALYVAIFNAAIGLGALVGGRLLATTGVQGMALFSAVLLLAGGLLIVKLRKPD